jgi:hypothetical protein
MLTERTIRAQLARLRLRIGKLPPRSSDHAYGAAEALEWVLGKGVPLRMFEKGCGQ